MAYKIKVRTNKNVESGGVWDYVLDVKNSRVKPKDRIFMNEEEAKNFIQNEAKHLQEDDYIIEEIS